jgi:hypothetical protein
MERKTNWITTVFVCVLILSLVIGVTIVKSQRHFFARRGYRLTADVAVDGRHDTASQNYAYDCGSRGNVAAATPCEVYGTAMHVDLGARGSLFITMNGWNAGNSGFSGANILLHQLLFAAQHGHEIPPESTPVMVRFRDPANPATAQVVDPAHLDRTFGPGVALTSLTIAPALPIADPGDIDTALPWLTRLKGSQLSPLAGDPALRLHGYDFKWPPA